MRMPWSALGLFGAIASSIPLASSHEIHLAYSPVSDSNSQADSYLSVKWSMQDGSLYANNDRVFPPSPSMQVHAPQYDSAHKTRIGNQVQLYYSMDARPLSSHEVGAPNNIVRVKVHLFDEQGDSVTPNNVVLDLLDHPDGSLRIMKIRIEQSQSQQPGDSESERPWQMKFWHSEGILSKQSNKQESSTLPSESESESETISQSESDSNSKSTATTDDSNPSPSKAVDSKPSDAVVVDSTVGYIFSPYFAPASYSQHRSPRRPHGRNRDHTVMGLIRPVVLPAFLGAIAGLIACLFGFLIGHVIMSVSVRLGFRQKRQQRQQRRRRSRIATVEDDASALEKAEVLPTIVITELEDIEKV